MNMSREIKEDLLPRLKACYARRGREGRSRLLDELCQDYHYERKYAIKLLGGSLPPPSGRQKPGPEPKDALIEPIVRTIWLAAEQPCSKRLAPALELWLPHYERHHERVSSRQRQLLQSVSPATLDRLLAAARKWPAARRALPRQGGDNASPMNGEQHRKSLTFTAGVVFL
jgi:hypothetical protein